MITTSDIQIENFNNDSTEYSFNVVLTNGDLTDKIAIAVEYDTIEEKWYIEDMTVRTGRISCATKFDAHFRAIKKIRKYKEIYC